MTTTAIQSYSVHTLGEAIHCLIMSEHVPTVEWLTDSDIEKNSEYARLLEEVLNQADSVLITEQGRPNYDAMRMLRQFYGYNVTRGEFDSFGWLSAVIHTVKGNICFG